jgi:hypothetical protein
METRAAQRFSRHGRPEQQSKVRGRGEDGDAPNDQGSRDRMLRSKANRSHPSARLAKVHARCFVVLGE